MYCRNQRPSRLVAHPTRAGFRCSYRCLTAGGRVCIYGRGGIDSAAAAAFTWKATCQWQRGTHSRSTVEDFSGLGTKHRHRHSYTFDVDQSLFGEGYAERFQALRIANALWVLRWYSLTGYPAGVDRAALRLAGYLTEIGLG